MTDIREHMKKEHNTPHSIASTLSEEQLEDWDKELHPDTEKDS
jgi:predicted small metal-binding protein